MSLGAVLAFISLASLLLVLTLPGESLTFGLEGARRRVFKGHGIATELKVMKVPRWGIPQVALLEVPEGLLAEIEESGGKFRLSVSSKFAGAFSGLKVKMGIREPLGLYKRDEVREVKMVFEFLPSVLAPAREPMLISATMLGDFPAGRSGLGQEFYSAEAYTSSHSSKDIMWKRLAKSPGENLMARVGEANIPEKLTVSLIEQITAPKRANPSWKNLVSEAVARVGVPVVSIGSTLRLVHVLGKRKTVAEARSLPELADLVMSLWREDLPKKSTTEEPDEADIVVAGQEELTVPDTRGMVSRKPAVILSWGGPAAYAGPKAVSFTGTEDISRLVVGVLSR